MSQTAQISVQYVNPRGGQDGTRRTVPANVKDTNGVQYTIDDAAVAYFQPGAQGNITFFVNQKGYNVATHWNGQELPRKQPAQGFQPAAASMPNIPSPAVPLAAPSAAPVDAKEEGMFIMGVVGRAMGSGTFTADDIPVLTKLAAYAWKHRHDTPPMTNIPQLPEDPPFPSPEDYGQ